MKGVRAQSALQPSLPCRVGIHSTSQVTLITLSAVFCFADLQGFSHPGTVSSEFKRTELHAWRQDFYDRLSAHAERAATTVASVKAVAASAAPSAAAAAAVVKTEPAAAVKTEPTAVVKTEPAAAAARMKPAAAVKTEPTATTTVAGGASRDAGVTVSIEDGCPKIAAFAGKRQVTHRRFSCVGQLLLLGYVLCSGELNIFRKTSRPTWSKAHSLCALLEQPRSRNNRNRRPVPQRRQQSTDHLHKYRRAPPPLSVPLVCCHNFATTVDAHGGYTLRYNNSGRSCSSMRALKRGFRRRGASPGSFDSVCSPPRFAHPAGLSPRKRPRCSWCRAAAEPRR